MRRCFACDKFMRSYQNDVVITSDGQTVYAGPDCFKLIKKAKEHGYQPPKGGPKLYLIGEQPRRTTQAQPPKEPK